MADRRATTTAPRPARLRRDQTVSEYDDQGYLIIPELLDPALLAATRAESVAICRGDRGAIDGVVRAGANEEDASVLRRYLCIHFPHKVSSLARDIARLPAAVETLADIIGPNVKMMRCSSSSPKANPAKPGTRTRPTSPPEIDRSPRSGSPSTTPRPRTAVCG